MAAPDTLQNAPIRRTRYGQVAGVDNTDCNGTHCWKGIPYASPPVGDLRWRAPRDPAPWTGVRPAQEFGAGCTQFPRMYSPGLNNTFDASVGEAIASGQPTGSEDCLTLNIWRPAQNTTGLPVVVFIHGGSNTSGYSGDPMYDGAALAQRANLVVVSANYRLGQLGFFRHAALRDRAADPTLTDDDCSGNFAVLDILKALHFVQDNIDAFGGDANNVTLMGQSAGAINILAILATTGQRNTGLFHKLVPMSGGVSVAGSPGFPQPVNDLAGNHGYLPGLVDTPVYEQLGHGLLLKLLIASGTASDAQTAQAWVEQHDNATIADWLRKQPASTICQVGEQTLGGIGKTTACGPIPEGSVIATDPIAAILAGQTPALPVLCGLARHECKLLSFWLPLIGKKRGIQLNDSDLFATLYHADKARQATFGEVMNPAYPDVASYNQAIEALDAKFFGALRQNVLDALITQQPNQVWSWRFDWAQEPVPWDQIYGAAHLFDLPFVLGNFGPSLYANVIADRANQTGRLALSGLMMDSLASFAHHGNPNHAGLGTAWPNWPRQLLFDADKQQAKISVD